MTRSRAVTFQLFKTKSPEHLLAEAAAPERQLKRALSAFDLTCIGIGAIIGTGIFALAGTAAAGEQAHAVGSIWKTPVLNFRGALLCRTRRDDSGLGLGLYVFVCDAG